MFLNDEEVLIDPTLVQRQSPVVMFRYLESMDIDQQQHWKIGSKPLTVEVDHSFLKVVRYPTDAHCEGCLLLIPNPLR